MVENKLDLEWVCDTRVDLVNQELLETMKQSRMQNNLVRRGIGFAEDSAAHRAETQLLSR